MAPVSEGKSYADTRMVHIVPQGANRFVLTYTFYAVM